MSDNLNELKPGHEIQNYRIERTLGRGNFGVTYLAHDDVLDFKVAIKEFFPSYCGVERVGDGGLNASGKGQNQYDSCQQRFLSEAKRLAKFRNPTIPRILNLVKYNNTAYIVMEYEKGASLLQAISSGRMKGEHEILKMLNAVASALKVVHDEDIIHRDLKPVNIYIKDNGAPMILDFGAARQYMGEKTVQLTTILTPGYAPIEQYTGKSTGHGPWTDIYSLGAVLYYIASGEKPCDSLTRNNELMNGNRDPLVPLALRLKGKYSSLFLKAIDKALMFKPQERPQTMDEWIKCFRPERPKGGLVTIATTEQSSEVIYNTVSKIRFFKGLSEYERKRISANKTSIQKCGSGTIIVKEGDVSDCFYVILSGSVSVMKKGNVIPITEISSGGIFGEMAFVTNKRRVSSVVANEQCQLLRIDETLLTSLGAEIREKVKDRIMVHLVNRVNLMNQKIHTLMEISREMTQ